jgi:phosphomannomutase/phosphoglucomutase
MLNIATEIFREYDIRGQYPLKLDETLTRLIGKALGSEILLAKQQYCFVAWDGRHSSPSLRDALISGICSTGCHVKLIGATPTANAFWAIKQDNQSCAMITGSHNPKQDNGIKIAVAGSPRSGEDIQVLLSRIQLALFSVGNGRVEDASHLMKNYQQRLTQGINLKRPLKVVLDAGNGIGGPIARDALRAIGVQVTEIACEVDGDFPLHHPDPAKTKNLKWLKESVMDEGADFGFALDGDADRIGVVDNRGQVILPDRLSLLFIRDILLKQRAVQQEALSQSALTRPPLKQETVLFDVKCTDQLHQYVHQFGGLPMMIATGHTSMKRAIKETNAIFATELSGHILFNDECGIGVDDGIYAGLRLCQLLAEQPESLNTLMGQFPQPVATEEIQVTVKDSEKFSIMSLIQHHAFKQHDTCTIDGIRVQLKNGWALVRASNTTPCLTLRFEALDQESLMANMDLMSQEINALLPDLKLDLKAHY